MVRQSAPSTSGIRHGIVAALSVIYGIFLLLVAFWPSPIDEPVASLIDRVIDELHERRVPSFVNYQFIEFTANVVLFVPVGVLFGLAVGLRFWPVAVVGGPLLSIGIEIVQGAMLSSRYTTVSDVLANSIGAIVGVGAAFILRALVAARDRRVIARYRAVYAALD